MTVNYPLNNSKISNNSSASASSRSFDGGGGVGVGSPQPVGISTFPYPAIWVAYIVVGVVGLLVIVVVLSWTNMRRKAPNVFIIGQCAVDMTAAFFVLMTAVAT